MKWNTKYKDVIESGHRRIITKFLLLPRDINGVTRWLEKASIEQEAYKMHDPTSASEWIQWNDLRWID